MYIVQSDKKEINVKKVLLFVRDDVILTELSQRARKRTKRQQKKIKKVVDKQK